MTSLLKVQMMVWGVPHPCQKQPTEADNHEHSGDIRTTSDLSPHSCRACPRRPDKEPIARRALSYQLSDDRPQGCVR
jgi:hypothetical protein